MPSKKTTETSDLAEFKAQILRELREQLAKEAREANAAEEKAQAGETQDRKAQREVREKIHTKFQEATKGEDSLHIVATSFRKFAEHVHDGRSIQRASQMVAEELEQVAAEIDAIVPSSDESTDTPAAERA